MPLQNKGRSIEHQGRMEREVPQSFTCPLTGGIMEDPVMDLCAHNFERTALTRILQTHPRCPISHKPLVVADLVSNHVLGERIDKWKWHNEYDGLLRDVDETCSTAIDEESQHLHRMSMDNKDDAGHLTEGDIEERETSWLKKKKRRFPRQVARYKAVPRSLMLLPQEREAMRIAQSKDHATRELERRRRLFRYTAISFVGCLFMMIVGVLYAVKR